MGSHVMSIFPNSIMLEVMEKLCWNMMMPCSVVLKATAGTVQEPSQFSSTLTELKVELGS